MDAIWFQQTLERAGASQADLARHLRLAPSAVSRMMKGERQMKLLEAVQIAAFLGVSQDEVLRHAGASAETVPRAGPARGRTVAGAALFVLGVYGLLVDYTSEWNFLPLDRADEWLHIGLGIGMLYAGLAVGLARLRPVTSA